MRNAKENIPFDWQNGAWKILREMLTSPGFLIQHQIGPFNDFLDKGLGNVIEQFNPIILNYDFITEQKFFRFKEDSKHFQIAKCLHLFDAKEKRVANHHLFFGVYL